jgi:hypothetical protein
MEQQQLLANYDRIRESPMLHPQPVDVRAVAPYIGELELGLSISRVQDTGAVVQLAGPPIHVHGALNIFRLRCNEYGQVILEYAFTTRRRVSYITDPPTGLRFEHFAGEEQAENFAATRWGERMLWDEARAVLVFHVIRPHGSCIDTGVAWVTAMYPTMFADCGEPASQLLDDVIYRCKDVYGMSWSPLVGCELAGHHRVVPFFFCHLCGGGVGESCCGSCNTSYAATILRGQSATDFPLPRSLARRCPCAFEQPVELARIKEAEAWARGERVRLNYHEPVEGRRQRVIDIDEDKDES